MTGKINLGGGMNKTITAILTNTEARKDVESLLHRSVIVGEWWMP